MSISLLTSRCLIHTGSIVVPANTLSTMMKRRGHTMIDVLKIDVEGVELDLFPMGACHHLPVHQLLVEFHHRFDRAKGVEKRTAIIGWMESCGYTVMSRLKDEEYTFVRTRVIT
jgi:hypothetical protein